MMTNADSTTRLLALALALLTFLGSVSPIWAEEPKSASLRQTVPIEPKFGFEPETRGPIGQVLAVARPEWNFVVATAMVLSLLGGEPTEPLADMLVDGNSIGFPMLMLAYMTNVTSVWFRVPLVRRWQKIIFRRRGLPYEFEDVNLRPKVVNLETQFWLQPATDVGVMETKTQPATVEELRANQKFIDDVIFNRVNTFGATGAYFFGSGHVHIDRETAFGEDALLLRNFVVDLINHPGLYLGPLVRDRLTSHDPRRYLRRVREVIDAFDRGTFTDMEELVNRLHAAGLSRSTAMGSAITFSRRIKTIELRFPRAQKNGDEMILWAEMFRARLNYLAAQGGRIELKPYRFWRSPLETYREIKAYVTETGLPWDPYEQMLPRRWRWLVGPLADFRATACETKLTD